MGLIAGLVVIGLMVLGLYVIVEARREVEADDRLRRELDELRRKDV